MPEKGIGLERFAQRSYCRSLEPGAVCPGTALRRQPFRDPREQRGSRSTTLLGLTTLRQTIQHVPSLLTAGRYDGEHVLNEAAARLAVGAVTCPAPQDRVAQRPLRRVVGRLDARD